jgi:hypothetical protein
VVPDVFKFSAFYGAFNIHFSILYNQRQELARAMCVCARFYVCVSIVKSPPEYDVVLTFAHKQNPLKMRILNKKIDFGLRALPPPPRSHSFLTAETCRSYRCESLSSPLLAFPFIKNFAHDKEIFRYLSHTAASIPFYR